jgi:CxxC motif-containing protein (DUF1111 family)
MAHAKIKMGFIIGVLLFAHVAAAVDPQPHMGQPLAGLTPAQVTRFNAGKTAFERIFTAAEGLGPILNQQSCASCHNNPVGGSGAISVTRFGFFDKKGGGFDPLESLGGSLLQSEAISTECAETIPPEATVVTQRITTSSLGLGLLEAILDADILANESPGPGVSGHAHMVTAFEDPPMSPLRVGRFGWKAQVATVLTFSADAALNEMGITNRFLMQENDPNGVNPPDLGTCDTVADPEDGPDGEGFHFIDRVTDFQRFLASPPQTPKSGMTGEGLFNSIGCAACHVPAYTTSNNPGLEDSIRNKAIRPYSDFLVHDMGLLGDGIAQGQAEVREIRTPPLWGVRIRDPLLHDGRVAGGTLASRITEAVAEHGVFGSEAAPSAAAFSALTPPQKNQVIAFLDSLGRAEFDADGDNNIGPSDLASFATCYGGGPYNADSPCAVHDIDQDGDVDDDDFTIMLTVYSGSQADCNSNSINDARDLLLETSTDCNLNGVPDECDSDSQDVTIFVAVLLGQNSDPVLSCMLDKNHDGDVNGDDIGLWIQSLLAL